MPIKVRPWIACTDEWSQIQPLVESPEQARYEVLRPVVLFGHSPAERARETGLPKRTLYVRTERFDLLGMRSLFDPDPHQAPARPTLPPHIRQLIVDLKAEYPPFHLRELAAICYVATARRPSPHTIQRVLADGPRTLRAHRRYPPYAAFTDVANARVAIIRLHAEGWRVGAIAGYLEVHRTTVHRVLARWAAWCSEQDDGPRNTTHDSTAEEGDLDATDAALTAVKAQLGNRPHTLHAGRSKWTSPRYNGYVRCRPIRSLAPFASMRRCARWVFA